MGEKAETWSSASLGHSTDPVLRPAMAVGNGQNPNGVRPQVVGDVIAEHVQNSRAGSLWAAGVADQDRFESKATCGAPRPSIANPSQSPWPHSVRPLR